MSKRLVTRRMILGVSGFVEWGAGVIGVSLIILLGGSVGLRGVRVLLACFGFAGLCVDSGLGDRVLFRARNFFESFWSDAPASTGSACGLLM